MPSDDSEVCAFDCGHPDEIVGAGPGVREGGGEWDLTSGLQGDRGGDHPLLGRGRPLIGNQSLGGTPGGEDLSIG